jgi:Ser/Thr protein kinase RdoA (MazF antagonist)
VIFASLAVIGAGLQVAAFTLEHEAKIGAAATVLAWPFRSPPTWWFLRPLLGGHADASPVGRLGGDAQALDRGPKRQAVSQGRRLTGRRALARELGVALAPYGVQVDRLRRPPAGLARHTFLVGHADATVVVKLAPREHRTELVKRLRVLRAVRPRELEVPRPLTAEPLELAGGLAWAYRSLPGRNPRACALGGRREAFGALAGRLDAALAAIEPGAGHRVVPSADLEAIAAFPDGLRGVDACGCTEVVAGAADAAVQRLARMDLHACRRQYVHRDLNDGNVLADPISGRCAAIDFDTLAVDLLPREVAVPVGVEVTRRDGGADLRRAGAVLSGYLAELPLREEERRAVAALSLVQWVEGVVFLCSRAWPSAPVERLARYRRKALLRLAAVQAALPALEEACLRARAAQRSATAPAWVQAE